MTLKRRRRPPPRRHAASTNVVSGVIYVIAAIVAIALGAMFYAGYSKARKAARQEAVAGGSLSGALPPGAKVIAKTETPKPARPSRKSPLKQPVPTKEPVAAPVAPSGTPPTTPTAAPAPPKQPAQPIQAARGPLAPYPRTPWQPVASDFPNPLTQTLYPTTNVGYRTALDQPAAVSDQLTIRGDTHFILSAFTMADLKGWTIRRAVWHGRVANGRARELGFSTIATEWDPRTGAFSGLPLNTYPGSPELIRLLDGQTAPPTPEDAVFRGHGASLLFTVQPHPPDNGPGQWIAVELDPAIIQSLVAGTAYGIVISDEAGQIGQPVEFAADADNRFYIEIDGGISDVVPPGPVKEFRGDAPPALARSQSVGVVLDWTAPGDDDHRGQAFRYDLRYAREDCGFDKAMAVPRQQLPFPQPAGHPDRTIVEGLDPNTMYYFYLRAADEIGQPGPITATRVATGAPWVQPVVNLPTPFATAPIEVASGSTAFFVLDEFSDVNPLTGQVRSSLRQTPEPGARRSFLWDRSTRTIRLRACRNETVAVQLVFGRKTPVLPPLTLTVDTFTGTQGDSMNLAPALYRVWYTPGEINGARAWIGDGLVPLDTPLQMPWPNNAVPNQLYQSVYAEWTAPADARPGFYRGHLFVESGPGQRDTLNVFLEISEGDLPEQLPFSCEWMIPPSLAALYRRDPTATEEVIALEKEYLQLARAHRCEANFFPYLPNGACQPPFRPVSGTAGGECHIDSWDAWDARIGALRSLAPETPVTLPLFENWPVPFSDGYLCFDRDARRPDGLAVYAGGLSEMENCLHVDYLRLFRSALRQFGEHLAVKGWRDTPAWVWLNNQPVADYTGRAPVWSFGQPRCAADFAALELFGRLVSAEARGAAWSSESLRFRVAVPRAAALRDAGVGSFDLLAAGDPSPWGWSLLRTRATTHGEALRYYSEALPQGGTCLPVEALGMRFYLEGADGWIIRDVVGLAENWAQARPFSLAYNGLPFGQNRPYPSLRLKALRRTLQDIALLHQLAEKKQWTRRQTADFVYGFLAARKTAGASVEDWILLRHAVRQLLLP